MVGWTVNSRGNLPDVPGQTPAGAAEELPEIGVIEPGSALALADFSPPAVGAGERLIRMAYAMGLPPGSLKMAYSTRVLPDGVPAKRHSP